MKSNIIQENLCTGCMACNNICPKKAINIETGKDGFSYPKIDKSKCINCGLCKKVCPVLNNLKNNKNKIEVYSCKNKNDKIRMKSSSGGVFTLIAEYIIKQNGIVFGAKFNKKLEVIHDYTDNIDKLEEFRGSKYLQSKIENTYTNVKKFLIDGKKVLFTGTPCQVEGLLSFLNQDYENLYTQDIICHGVPSPKVWKKHLEYKKEQNSEYPILVNFRYKDILGWNNYQIKYIYSNHTEQVHHNEDPYMKFFLNNIVLRKSCYNCKFKSLARNSDITIADFWGIEKIDPKIYDEKGISAILVNSRKGREIFENIKQNLNISYAKIEDIIKYNSCINQSTKYNSSREKFFCDLEKNSYEKLIQKYL